MELHENKNPLLDKPKVRSNSRAIKATQFGKQRLLYHMGIALNLGFILEVERMNV